MYDLWQDSQRILRKTALKRDPHSNAKIPLELSLSEQMTNVNVIVE